MYYILKKQKESFLHTCTLMNKLVHVISVGFKFSANMTKMKKITNDKNDFFFIIKMTKTYNKITETLTKWK